MMEKGKNRRQTDSFKVVVESGGPGRVCGCVLGCGVSGQGGLGAEEGVGGVEVACFTF